MLQVVVVGMAEDERSGKLSTIICFLIVCALRVSDAATKRCNAGDSASLLEIKARLSDDEGQLASWNATGVDCCQWSGVTCNSAGRVQNLSLGGSLRGSVSSSLGNLSSLASLVLTATNVTGPIPSSLGNLPMLSHLDLSYNFLTGLIPPSLGNLSVLTYLDLSENLLTGSLLWLPQLRALNLLYLGNNGLAGSIPAEIGDMEALTYLDLSMNNLSGEIPKSVGRLSNLTFLDLSLNSLRGIIPAELGNLTKCTTVWIADNLFSGHIPPELGKISSLNLYIYNNHLWGPIPDTFQNLSVLHASGNSLTGVFPLSLAAAFWVDLSNNNLRSFEQAGSLPEIWSLSNLLLADNFLKGRLPEWLVNCTRLGWLDLSNNELYGDISPRLGELQGLQYLNLSRNNLSGVIPQAFANLTSLMSLDLSTNQLHGTIPSLMALDLAFLAFFNVSSNLLSGRIPEANHFSTFPALSFTNNRALCGPPLTISCSTFQGGPPSSTPSLDHQIFMDEWISFPAIGVGMAIGFSVVSSFLLPYAYASGKRARIERTVPRRREQYGLFRDPS